MECEPRGVSPKLCEHCKKQIQEFVLMSTFLTIKDAIFFCCFCNFTKSQIKELIDKNNLLDASLKKWY